ncbi:glucosidase II beta subunit-like protein [Ceratobasidium sp. AG-Ba]|nr:glucosidase II beta subunit-like protein [Ceratobasidium sp. AG-Ba]
MSRPLATLAAVLSLWTHHAAAYSSLPEDVYAYPKYSIGFLNGLPLPNVTAQHWLAHGLKGGEKEFLEQPWEHESSPGSSRPQITGGETINSDGQPAGSYSTSGHRLEHMRLGPGKEYVCLIPPPDEGSAPIEDPAPPPSHPSKTWNLLQPLSGKCLYHRQGWFTYSYCHNDHVRQFREMTHGHPHPIQGRIPEEDTEWEAYNLGVSPAAKQKAGSDVSRQAEAAAANLELQRAADQRYLVQRWGDGTQCDKTGRKREIEIQFHCSMSSVDHIVFVKEVSVCNYLIVIHTPRICSEPGFKSQRDSVKAAPVRCREIVSHDTVKFDRSQFESPIPNFLAPSRPILPAAPPPSQLKDKVAKGKSTDESDEKRKFLDVAISALFGAHVKDRALAGKTVRVELDDGVHELDFRNVGLDAVEDGTIPDMETVQRRMAEVLKAAGYDVRTDEWELAEERQKNKKAKKEQRKVKEEL